MQKDEFLHIASKVDEGLATDQEKQLFLYHITTFARENPEWRKLSLQFRQKIQEDLRSDIHLHVFGKAQVSKTLRLWLRIAIVAAVATMIFGTGLFLFPQKQKENSELIPLVNDAAPGRQGATLTLANGKKIRLNDATNGKLAEEAGVNITKSSGGQLAYEVKDREAETDRLNTLATANGETYQVRLPDGSIVNLNAASSLTYATSLTVNGKRLVRLLGEAYFQVTKDQKHPFIVQTEKQEVEVLGTHFNIMAYNDEPIIATTLVEGSVKIKAGGKERILKPNEQALNNGKSIKVVSAELENITDWKEGDFNLNRVDLRVAMRKIARWYDVEVVYEENFPEDILAGGWISRSQKLSTIIRSLEKSGLAKFQVKGKTIYVSK